VETSLKSSENTGLSGADLLTGAKRAAYFRAHRLKILSVILLPALGIALLLRFGGYILVSPEAPPEQADVAVMLAGKDSGEEARLALAMKMVQEGRVQNVMLSAGRTYFLGEWFPDLVRRYVERQYGGELGRRVVLCDVASDVDSTAQEAAALTHCLETRGVHSFVVVTSNYHTRRARLIWRRTLAKARPQMTLSIVGVADGDFETHRWWHERRYAKTWLVEFTKLVWSFFFDRGD